MAAVASEIAAEHFVQFYRDEQVLIDSIVKYVRQGIRQGGAAVAIGTAAHTQAVESRLRDDGLDTALLGRNGQLILLDAQQTLATFMVAGAPERERFFAQVGGIVSAAAQRYGHVFAFGEMVAILWKDDRTDAAVALERLWNELARQQPLTLFCAYPLQDCGDEHHIAPFEAVCASHTLVMPVGETEPAPSRRHQQRSLAQLQQRALVLERKLEQEVQVQQKMAHLASIVDSSDDAIISKTLDGVILSWNAAAQRLFGWSAEEIIGRPITLIIPAERLQEEQHILDTLRRGDRIDHFETTRVAKDGRELEISLTVSPIRNAAGTVIGAAKIARDITARKRSEALLRQQEHALQQAHSELQSRMNELVRFNKAAIGREMRIIELKSDVNALSERLGEAARYALEFDQQPQAPVAVPAGPQESEQAVAPLESILCTEQLQLRPSRPADYARESRALTALVQALADAPRSILQTLAATTLEVLQAGSAGLSLLTEDGKRFYWGAIAGQWSPHLGGGTPRGFGPCGDVLDCNAPLLFTHWERRYPYLAAATPLCEEGLLVPFCVDGRAVGTIWVISHDPACRFDAEDLRVLLSLGRFASAAYQATEHMGFLEQGRAALSLLEDAVQARALIEESNRKLRLSEEELREADRHKNEFLALLGHELRNPLAPISNAGELLSRTLPADSCAQLAVDMVKRQTGQLTRLVDDLLDIGRITQGRVQLQRQPIALSSVIAQAVETIDPKLREKQQEISILTSASRPLYVDGDFARLVQCIGNVLTNATKYTDPHGKIRIETRAQGASAIIEISDTGVGISAELLPRVFDLFVQSERTLDRAQGGLGIGLSIVKKLIEMHEGEVSARSPGLLGSGSTFEIRLPCVARVVPAQPADTPSHASACRVLIVDDNMDGAISLAMLLSFQGHEAEAVHSGKDALERIEAFRPDVALLDIGLPEMDGYALAKRLRAMPQLQGLRLIALTGYGQAEDRQRALAGGFDEHLIKPVNMQALERALAGASHGEGPAAADSHASSGSRIHSST